MSAHDGITKLVGLVELGQEHEDMKTIENCKISIILL